jgi:Ca-activated chloride channel family protein
VTDWTFVHVERIHLVWFALVIIGGLFALEIAQRNAMASFLSPAMQPRLTERASTTRMVIRLSLTFVSMLFAIAAVMRPQAKGEQQTITSTKPSADVMFVLDTSRSMLAEDVAPTRFDRAKADIGNMVDRLDGHRVGLIAFAGRAASMCPLTPDHSFFRTALSTVDTRSSGRGGTKVGEAIKTALRGFPPGPGAKLIVLITDGDDQDPYSEEAAKLARDAGVRIIAIGFGSEAGSQITLVDPKTKARSVLMHEGKPVISKLAADQLKKIALVTEGVYIPVGTSAIDLDDIIKSHVMPILRSAEAAAQRSIPAEKFQFFVFASLLVLLAALFTGSGKDRA